MKTKNLLSMIILAVLFASFAGLHSCGDSKADKAKADLENFIKEYESKVTELYKTYNLAAYAASVTGKEDDYKKEAEMKIALTKIHANKENYAKLKQIKESGLIKDQQLKRQLDLLYNQFLLNQIDEKALIDIIMLESQISKKFSTYRVTIDEKEIFDNEIDDVLRNSTDNDKLAKYWRASKRIGREVDDDLIALVKKRNEVAKSLGFNNFYEMMLIANDQKPEEIQKLFDELDVMTEGPYMQLKQEMDEYLHKYYKVQKADLMPWHYQNRFFQEAPAIYNVKLDDYYKSKDIVGLTNTFFSSIGLEMMDILSKSDLYDKPGKSQLAFTSEIDRMGDARITANLQSDKNSMYVLLYETGFATPIKNIDTKLPFVLRTPSHFIINDAIGDMFARFSSDTKWMMDVAGVPPQEIDKIKDGVAKDNRLQKFVFARWAQVMYRFEKSMYENPDQDLNDLWWKLVQKYQMLQKPHERNEPDWASKTHIITKPCTYHNYMLGELLASQITFYIDNQILKENKNYLNNKMVGQYLIDMFFTPSATMPWNELIKKATGEYLSPEHFANQYIKLK